MAIYMVSGRFEMEVEASSEKDALRKADSEIGMVVDSTSNMSAFTFDDDEDEM